MLYSIRMRAAKGGAHETGGLHISGAERLQGAERVADTAGDMVRRAMRHSKGRADFIRLTIDEISEAEIKTTPLPKIEMWDERDVPAGRRRAAILLRAAGVSETAAARAIEALGGLEHNMRGAMIVSAVSGERLDRMENRGVRVTKMDADDDEAYSLWLNRRGLRGIHAREAVVLAAKVMAAPGVVAELCWSDDPEYAAGYVAASHIYHRIAALKEIGCARGGRVFFVIDGANIGALIEFLENRPVLVCAGGET